MSTRQEIQKLDKCPGRHIMKALRYLNQKPISNIHILMTICEYFIENLKQGIKISQSPIKSGVHSL